MAAGSIVSLFNFFPTSSRAPMQGDELMMQSGPGGEKFTLNGGR